MLFKKQYKLATKIEKSSCMTWNVDKINHKPSYLAKRLSRSNFDYIFVYPNDLTVVINPNRL